MSNLKVAIMYESMTGNTKMLADAIKDVLNNQVIYSGKYDLEIAADIYFLGSWVDKGSKNTFNLFNDFSHKNIAIFGTCGFNKFDYTNRLFERAKSKFNLTNNILGGFYSLGKMKREARDKFIDIIKANPLDKDLDIKASDYDLNQTHPDQNDLKNVKAWTLEMVKKVENNAYKR